MTRYYVDGANGSDSNPGTESQPWQTLGKITTVAGLAGFSAGDEVWVKPGTYTNKLTLAQSGSAGAPIWILGDPRYDSLPVIQSNDTNGILVSGQSHQRFSNFNIITPTVSSDDLFICNNGNGVIIESCILTGATGGNGRGIRCQGTSADFIARRNIVTECVNDGISVANAVTNFLIEYNVVQFIGDATYAGGTGDGITTHDTCTGTARGNYIRRCSNRGFANTHTNGNLVTVEHNVILDCMRFGILMGSGATIGDHDIIGNVVFMTDSLTALGGASFMQGIALTGSATSTATIRLYHNTVINPCNNANHYSYYDNTNDDSSTIISRNNSSIVLAANGRHVRLNDLGTLQYDFDYNSYYPDTGSKFFYDVDGTGATVGVSTNMAGFRTGLGGANESHSITGDPLFVNEALLTPPGAYDWATDVGRWPAGRAAADLFLKSTSPLRNAGETLAGIVGDPQFRDWRGRLRRPVPSMGAFEYYTNSIGLGLAGV